MPLYFIILHGTLCHGIRSRTAVLAVMNFINIKALTSVRLLSKSTEAKGDTFKHKKKETEMQLSDPCPHQKKITSQ